jgi:hypothetical protein
MAATAAGCAT